MSLDPDQVNLLSYLTENGPASTDILAKRSYVKNEEITRHIDGLVQQQLVVKNQTGEYQVIKSKER